MCCVTEVQLANVLASEYDIVWHENYFADLKSFNRNLPILLKSIRMGKYEAGATGTGAFSPEPSRDHWDISLGV